MATLYQEPQDWVTGESGSAVKWNQEIVANASETAPAKAVAKGDLFVGVGKNEIRRLVVGPDGQVVLASSAATLGVEWGEPPSRVTSLWSWFQTDQGLPEANWTDFAATSFLPSGSLGSVAVPIPSFATAFDSAALHFLPVDGAQVVFDILEGHTATDGESRTADSTTLSNVVVPTVSGLWHELDVSAAFPNAEPSDLLMLRVAVNNSETDAEPVYIAGMSVRFS